MAKCVSFVGSTSWANPVTFLCLSVPVCSRTAAVCSSQGRQWGW